MWGKKLAPIREIDDKKSTELEDPDVNPADYGEAEFADIDDDDDEEAIERLLPTKDYLWEKNSTLRERLKKATETLANPSNYRINQIMENLPTYLSYVDETVQTLEVYTERKEFLLNYPTAEAAIKEQLKKKIIGIELDAFLND